MNELTIFNYDQNEVRTIIGEDGEPWWIAKDVCDVLGIIDEYAAVKPLKDTQKSKFRIKSGNSVYATEKHIINEAGLYRLIFKSRKPDAEKFQDWIAEEVLPSIRKTGSYSIQKQLPQTKLEWMKLAVETEEKNEQLQIENKSQAIQIEQDKPKVGFCDMVTNSVNIDSIRNCAKVLDIRSNTFFKTLRNDKILQTEKYKGDPNHNVPYAKYINNGCFKVRKSIYIKNGKIMTCNTPKVTGRGMIFLTRKYGKKEDSVIRTRKKINNDNLLP